MGQFVAELKRRNVIRVAVAYAVIGWLVLQVTQTLVSMLELPEATNKFILICLVAAFIPMLLFSWVYELTSEGLKKEQDIRPADSILAHTAKRLDLITLVALFIVVSLGVLNEFRTVYNGVDSQLQFSTDLNFQVGALELKNVERSVAVLPFVNISADPDNEYFSDGVSEEILALLAKLDSLKVVSRTSSFSYKNKPQDLKEIGNQLGVSYIVEGSVRKSGNTVRITAQLIQVESNFHMWSETYDREMTDVFTIQNDIAKKIVQALQLELTPENMPLYRDLKVKPEAYDHYLKGRHLWHQRGEENLKAAIVFYKEAVEIDPEFARGWAALALATTNMVAYTTTPIEEIMPKAQSYAFRALALDSNQSEAIMVLPVMMAYEKRWDEVLLSLERAVKLDPSNSTARVWKSETLWRMGYLDKAYREMELASTLDPSSLPAIYDLAYFKFRLGDIDGALELSKQVEDFNYKNSSYLQFLLAQAQGNMKKAKKYLLSSFIILGISEDNGKVIVKGIGDSSARLEALVLLDYIATEIREKRLSKFNVDIVLEMYKQFGEVDRAISLVNDLAEDGTAFIDYAFWGEQNSKIRQHPEFINLIRRRGFLEYWHLHGWPDECRAVGSDIVCD